MQALRFENYFGTISIATFRLRKALSAMPPSIETHRIIDSALDALRRNGFENLIVTCELSEIVTALINVEPRLRGELHGVVRLAVSGWIATNQVSRPIALRYAPSFTVVPVSMENSAETLKAYNAGTLRKENIKPNRRADLQARKVL